MGTKNAKPQPPSTTRANPLSFPLPPLMRPANLLNPFDIRSRTFWNAYVRCRRNASDLEPAIELVVRRIMCYGAPIVSHNEI